ncbi:MAG: hypothetical protein AAF492_31565, partial [Verrucomicrobiota bacterium]
MGSIFVAYGRRDTRPRTETLIQHLKDEFGEDAVITGLHDRRPDSARKQIKQLIDASDLVIAVIGEGWLAEVEEEARPPGTDDLRFEIEYGLKTNKLMRLQVDSTTVPDVDALPESLKPLNDCRFIAEFTDSNQLDELYKLIRRAIK